jgi:phosphatidylglycerophosphate synthase
MTLAVLCGTDRSDAAGPVASLAGDLTAALSAAGARDVRVLPGGDPTTELREIAGLARTAGEPLLLCADDLVAHPGLLRILATEPGGRSTVLVVADTDGDLREDRGRLLSATPEAATARFLGAFCIAGTDLALLADAADRAADSSERADPAAGTRTVGVGVGSAVDTLLPALLDAGLVPVATRVRLLHAERVTDAAGLAAARAAVAAVDEDRALLRLAVKEKDDFFTTYAVSSWSPLVTRWCARLGLTPSGVTAVSVLFCVAAAALFWQASRPAMIAGAVLLYLGFMLDCVDGQLARYTRNFGAFGGWLDTMADRAKEYVAYAGLAAGADRIGLPHAWPLAIAAMLLQTVRHMTDAWYGALHDEAAHRPTPAAAATGVGARLSQASNRVQADTGSPAYWAKRIVVFPIGERWALIAVLAAASNGRVALLAVLGWGLLAAAYTLGLRSLRSRSMRVPVLDTVDTARHRDDGPLVRSLIGRAALPGPLWWALVAVAGSAALLVVGLTGALSGDRALIATGVAALVVLTAGLPAPARHDGALDWLVPAALRAAEYLMIVAVGLIGEVPSPVVFILLFAVTLHHYDLTARMEKGVPAGADARTVTGWDGRVLVLVVVALAGVATAGMAVLAGVVGATFVIGAIAGWRPRRAPSQSGAEGGPR